MKMVRNDKLETLIKGISALPARKVCGQIFCNGLTACVYSMKEKIEDMSERSRATWKEQVHLVNLM